LVKARFIARWIAFLGDAFANDDHYIGVTKS